MGEVIYSAKPLWAVLVSMIAALLILLTGERARNLRESWTIIAAVIKFCLVFSLIAPILQGKTIVYDLITLLPGVGLTFRVDAFGLLFGVIASTLWIPTSFYSIGYVRTLNEHGQSRYFFSFAMCLSSAVGVAFAGNLLTLLIFYEILTIATWPLVIHHEDESAVMGGRKYFAYTLTAGCILLLAIAITYTLTGTLDFQGGGFLAGHGSPGLLILLFVMFIAGFGVKAGLMPFHEWLPTAMVAPTPVSALLHAVAVVKAGVFGCVRVLLFVFGPNLLQELGIWQIMAGVAAFTVVAAGLLALGQDHLKRRLAFSTINNLALILLGVTLLSKNAITGGILHIANHAFMKITLFFCAGAIYAKTHKDHVSQLDGLGRQMPLTFAAFTIGAMGLSGIPPVNGFISKWFLCLGAVEAHQLIFLFAILTSAMLDVAFFFPIIYNGFFKKPLDDVAPHLDEAPMIMVIPLCLTALLSVTFGIMPDAILHFFSITAQAVASVLGG
ncbi:MAG: monovalent cation/H+ antiporter subunit D family protein [Deltaproteobacteria bacterium]|nr:monovalent cation/H+ antiporter subunit D family protein [Candidatus Anaeroferrophillus wilburensis]MBN2889102.1 monovalent cation/H+ antiporter subunit D family protein [Deltaproteobacteria bacterium]